MNDAQKFVEWLKVDAQVPEKNIEWIQIDPSSFDEVDKAAPTRPLINARLFRIMNALRDRLRDNPRDWQETRLYVYLSGHGIAQNERETTVLMANAQVGIIGENSIPCGAYAAYFQDVQTFAEVVFFADCCRSVEKKARVMGPGFDIENVTRGNVRRCVAFATGFGDLSYEPTAEEQADPDQTRGYFTTALLEALRGGLSPEEEVSTESIRNYVKARVALLTANKRSPQLPIIDAPEKIVFRQAQPPKPVAQYSVTLNFPPGWMGRVILSDGAFQQLDSHDPAVATPWIRKLPDGMYEVRPDGELTGAKFQAAGLFRVLGGNLDVQL
jgi:hypothetical protein